MTARYDATLGHDRAFMRRLAIYHRDNNSPLWNFAHIDVLNFSEGARAYIGSGDQQAMHKRLLLERIAVNGFRERIERMRCAACALNPFGRIWL